MNRPHAQLLLRMLCLVVACTALCGCYRRVVRAEGVSGDYKVYEPNLKSEKTKVEKETEDLLFGEQKPIKNPPR